MPDQHEPNLSLLLGQVRVELVRSEPKWQLLVENQTATIINMLLLVLRTPDATVNLSQKLFDFKKLEAGSSAVSQPLSINSLRQRGAQPRPASQTNISPAPRLAAIECTLSYTEDGRPVNLTGTFWLDLAQQSTKAADQQPPMERLASPAVTVAGDKVGGDKVGGDKVGGDKVGGDKVGGDKVEIGSVYIVAGKQPLEGGSPFATENQSRNELPTNVDLAIVAALPEELTPILGLIGGKEHWHRFTRDQLIYYSGEFPCSPRPLKVVACALSHYGGTATTAQIVRLQSLKPRMIAMTGICAGWQDKNINLGDVLVADRAFNLGHGKQTTAGFVPDTRTYQSPPWLMQWLKDFEDNKHWFKAITAPRPHSLRYQADWLLCQRAIHGTTFPDSPEQWQEVEKQKINCSIVVERLKKQKLLNAKGALTKKAEEHLATLRAQNYGQLAPIPDPAYPTVHYKAFATSEAVVAVDDPFADVAKIVRNVGALEMEVASLFDAASQIGVPAFAVKGVSDYATTEKDDSFRTYAAEAAACWIHAFVCANAGELQNIGA